MSAVDPHDSRLQARPLWGLAILLLPVLGVVFTLAAWGVMVGLGMEGRSATGAEMTIALEGCSAAREVVSGRLEDMGYDGAVEVTPAGFTVRFRGPADEDVRAGIPETLATPGLFEVRGGDRVLATQDDVVDASVRLDVLMVGSTLVHLDPEATDRVKDYVRSDPGGALDLFVDGERVGRERNTSVVTGEVEIAPDLQDDTRRLRAVAAWGVVIDHPLPCPVRVVPPPSP